MKNFETLEVGKTYKNRCGTFVTVTKMNEEDDYKFFLAGPYWFRKDGTLFGEEDPRPADLIELVNFDSQSNQDNIAIAQMAYDAVSKGFTNEALLHLGHLISKLSKV